MKCSSVVSLVLGAALLVAVPATQAVLIHLKTHLDGSSESPPVNSPGTGFATVDIDTDAHTMDVHAEWSGLVEGTTVAHIHCCTLPNAGVATTVPTFPGFPAGVTSGTYDPAPFDLTDLASFNPAFVTANGGTAAGAEAALLAGLLSGVAYFNIHTTFAQAGEIRGFFGVPEPGILGLLGLALSAAFVAMRRRRS